VPKDLLHDADVNSLLQEQRRGGMASIMRPCIPHTTQREHGLELSPITPWVDRPTSLITVKAPNLVALVWAGARFENGKLVERPNESGGDQQAA
jgi:hypothetical protein